MTALAAAPDVLSRIGRPLRDLRVCTVWGGGGLKLAYQVGVWAALERDFGVRIIESHGVSAGALLTAMLIQGRLDEMVEVAHTAMTSDVHRWRTGFEIVSAYFSDDLVALGRNDRLWSNYLERFVPADIGKTALMPGFVGAVDFETEEYLSIPHSSPDWAHAVWGSASMPPPVWEPIPWEGRYLVDGGVRSSNPVQDAYHRIFSGMLYCDLVICVPTGSGELSPCDPPGDIKRDSLRTIDIMTHQISRDDVERPDEINHILEQVGDAVPLFTRDGHRYRYVPTIYIRPSRSLGGALDSSPAMQKDRFDHGVQRVREVLGGLAA